MQIVQPSRIAFHVQFENEVTIPFALEITQETTGRFFTPKRQL